MNDKTREYIFETLNPLRSEFTAKIDQTFENTENMTIWIKSIENLLNFVDGL